MRLISLAAWAIACATTMTASQAAVAVAPAPTAASSRATALCGPGDKPETGMQGETPLADAASGRNREPYFCGMKIVAKIDPFEGGTSGFITRSRTCAYVHGSGPNGAGLAVVDASDPKHPKVVDFVTGPGAAGASETIDVIDAGDIHLLAAGDYSGGLEPPGPAPLDLYDTTDCMHPRHLATFYWPANVHTLKFTPDGQRIYAGRQFGTAGVMVVDVSDRQAPKYLGDFPLVLPGGRQQRCHDVWFTADQTRMYCAGSVPTIENRKDDSAPSVWDITLVGKTSIGPTGAWPAIRFVGTSATRGQGDHHAPLAVIHGKRYLVAANELRCSAFPRLFDASDEHNLVAVGEFRLEVTDRCLFDPEWAKANAAGGYGLHYNSVVDNAWGSAVFGMFNFMGSGIRIVDLKDPTSPREVAYYHPGVPDRTRGPFAPTAGAARQAPISDSCVSHDYFVQETGQIWFGCRSGFYIAELSAPVKALLLKN
jgi:hypothetical protein